MDQAILERSASARQTRSVRAEAGAPAVQGDRLRRRCAVAAGVVVVLLAGAWSATAGGTALAPAGPGEVALQDGVARVDQVVSAARPKHAMAGMGTDNDPVAEGQRRVSIDVTLQATGGDTLEYDVDRFTLAVGDDAARAPHRSVLPEAELPPGSSLAGTLVFDVPTSATTAQLAYDGRGATSVVLPPEAGTAPAQEPTDRSAEHGDSHS